MSDRKKFNAKFVKPVAEELCRLLLPFVTRIEIAGSLRRLKDEVSDIELLFIPRIEVRPNQKDFFSKEDVDLAAEKIDSLVESHVLAKRPSVDGKFTWGGKNKLGIHLGSQIPVDFFSTTPDNWWVSLVVRTGSKETNLRLTTGAQAKGCSLMAYGCGIKTPAGSIIAATSEEHVFELCGVPYLPPYKR